MFKSVMCLHQLLKGLVFLLVMSTASMTIAGSYAITPVRSTLSISQKINSLTITNQSAQPTTIQMQLMQWQQDEHGVDVFTDTKDILATPPVFTLQANAKQVIRLGLRKPPSLEVEQTYRLFLKEVPSAPREGFTGVNVALNMSIPVFVLPKQRVTPQMQWQLTLNAEKKLVLSAKNVGMAHIQVANFSLVHPSIIKISPQQVANYLLPNQQRQWIVENQTLAGGEKVDLIAQTDIGELKAVLIVE